MSEHYDVIIIGSGAGGGTLAHRLAPTGKQVLILERGDWLPREAQNWDAQAVFVDNRYVSPDQWFDGHGKPFQPQIHYFVGGATKFYANATSASSSTTTASHRPGPSSTPRWSPTTPKPSSSTRCTAHEVKTRPTRLHQRRTPFHPSPTSHASSGCSTT
jgi:choline dehydrogenase-like flavoprotein